MNSEEIKSLQAPLKEQYRLDPPSALITLKAEGKLGENISCKLDTRRAMIEAGLHPATGGTGLLACSGDLLLEALVACAGVTLNAVATSLGINIREGSVRAEGDIDFRGTLGVSREIPVGFKEIRLLIDVDGDVSPDQMQALQKLTERYCVVYQTINAGTKLVTSFGQGPK